MLRYNKPARDESDEIDTRNTQQNSGVVIMTYLDGNSFCLPFSGCIARK